MKHEIPKLIYIAYRDLWKHPWEDKKELIEFAFVILFVLLFFIGCAYDAIIWIIK